MPTENDTMIALRELLVEHDRLRDVETAAATYISCLLCGNPDTSDELAALIAAVRTGEFHG